MSLPAPARNVWLCCLAAAGSCLAQTGHDAPQPVPAPIDVVFVCQHGYAKSLVAAVHFEKMAADRGVAVRVVARGITPAAGVPEPLAAALRADGFEVGAFVPVALSAADAAAAEYVAAFGVDVAADGSTRLARWDDVPALSEDYALARAAIVAHLEELLDRIEDARPAGTGQHRAD